MENSNEISDIKEETSTESIKERFKSTKLGLKTVIIIFKNNYKLLLLNMFLYGIIFAMPFVSIKFINEYFERFKDEGFNHILANKILYPYYFIIVISALVLLFSGYVYRVYYFKAENSIKENIRNRYISNPSSRSRLSMGEVINTIRDDPSTIIFPNDIGIDLIGKFIMFAGSFFIVFMIDEVIAFVILMPMFILYFMSKILNRWVESAAEKSRFASATYSKHLGDFTSNIQTIKINGAGDDILRELKRHGENRKMSNNRAQVLYNLFWELNELSTGIALALVLLLSAAKMREGIISVSQLFIVTFILPRNSMFIQDVGRFLVGLQTSAVSLRRIRRILNTEDTDFIFDNSNYSLEFKEAEKKNYDGLNNKSSTEALKELEVKNYSSTFDGKNGVRNINFKLKHGEFLVITGRIGSGKSTLIRSLTGLKDNEKGEVLYNGRNIGNSLIPPIASYTPSNPNLFSDTIDENIRMGLPYDEQKMEKVISMSELNEEIKLFKNSLNTIIGSKGVKLSGGQRQRVALARMLYQESEILLLDDVSSALDIDTEIKLWENLKNDSRTRIAVSNRHNALKYADKIIVLKDGEIDSFGNLNELLEYSSEFRKIWGESR